MRPSTTSIHAFLAFTAAVLGCGGDGPTDGGPGNQVAAILFDYPVIPPEIKDYLLPGEALQLAAAPIDSNGNPVTGVSVSWSSSDSLVLGVSASGQLEGRAVGEATITATAGSKQAALPFAVLPPVASIELVPSELGLVPGGKADVGFELKDETGGALSPRPLTFTGSNASADISQSFGVLGVAAGVAGTATLTASREGKSDDLQVAATQVQFDTVDAGGGRGCGLTSGGTAWCWGTNSTGALGYGVDGSHTEGSGWTPVRVAGSLAFTQISVGNSHTCALTADGTAYCWGNNATGALGVSVPAFSASPIPVSGGLQFSQISASYAYTCGVTLAGAGYCWGFNDSGQLGDGTKATRLAPVPVAGGHSFTQISTRYADPFSAATCALTTAGAAYCWGANFNGQTGSGGFESEYLSPVAVAGGHTFAALSSAGSQSCALDGSGNAYCWGLNYGETPTPFPGGSQWRSISVMADHACGATTAGVGYCWGANDSGQLGDGTLIGTGTQSVPVAGGLSFQSISAALGFTCGLTSGGVAYCWGDGSAGQLGQNTTDPHPLPMRVLGQP